MGVDRMSPLDSSFLHIEDAVTHMHIGSVGLFEGPPPTYEAALLRMIESKLPLVPRYRQVVQFVPSTCWPVWVDDPHFNLEYHVRHTALPAPGGEADLRRLVGRVMAQQLDRTKPLWEIWMVEAGPGGPHLGHGVQDPPRHGRRRVRHRAAVGDHGLVARRRGGRPPAGLPSRPGGAHGPMALAGQAPSWPWP